MLDLSQQQGSSEVLRKHAAFDPASQKRLGFRLRSYKMGTVPFLERDSPHFAYHARSAFKRLSKHFA